MRKFDTIRDGHIIKCKLKDFNAGVVRENLLSTRFRILRIYNCKSWDLVKKKLEGEITALLEKCSYLLILVIEFTKCKAKRFNYPELSFIFPARCPFIINLVCGNCNDAEIFYTETKFDFERVDAENPPTWIQHSNRIALNPIQANLLKVELIKNRTDYLNAFAELGSALTIRFVKLFDEPKHEYDWHGIENSLNSNNIENFLAFMDFPYTVEEFKTSLSEELKISLKQVDENNKNVLSLAVEKGNVPVVRLLSTFDFDLDQAVEVAWKLDQYYCVLLLIRADSRFPKEFDIKQVDNQVKRKFVHLIWRRKQLHKAVLNGSVEEIESFVRNNPKLKHAYDEQNQSALSIALENKKFVMYASLLSRGFSARSDTVLSEVQGTLSVDDQKTLRDILRKSVQSYNEPHVLQLISKSKLAVGNDPKYFVHMNSIFSELNAIAEVSPILKLAAQSENLQIVFDFESTSIKQMDPTKSEKCRGTFYRNHEIIYIAAEFYSSCYAELLGTLAHELTHFAILLVYDNFCLPYKNGNENENKYQEVFGRSKRFFLGNCGSVESVVSDSFNCYDEGFLQKVELIVRVPQLAAMFYNNPNRISNSKRQFPELFSFYEKVLEDIITKSRMISVANDRIESNDDCRNNLTMKRKVEMSNVTAGIDTESNMPLPTNKAIDNDKHYKFGSKKTVFFLLSCLVFAASGLNKISFETTLQICCHFVTDYFKFSTISTIAVFFVLKKPVSKKIIEISRAAERYDHCLRITASISTALVQYGNPDTQKIHKKKALYNEVIIGFQNSLRRFYRNTRVMKVLDFIKKIKDLAFKRSLVSE